jgi:autotransporter-associated beta strand protein
MPLKSRIRTLGTLFTFVLVASMSCNAPLTSKKSTNLQEYVVELPQVSYPLPVTDHFANNSNPDKAYSIKENPVTYILRGINDIWKGTTDAYQINSSGQGPSPADCETGNPIIDSEIWRQNIQYVIKVTNNRTDDHALQAYLDENRSKYYSVIDGFGPLTEAYVTNSGAYVDFPKITRKQVLEDIHFQSPVNDDAIFAGDEASPLGAVVQLARYFRNKSTSSNPTKHLYSTPRPWRMNDSGAVHFLGTTYDSITRKPTYKCVDHSGNVTFKIFDNYESSVKILPGLVCSRMHHAQVFDDNNPSPNNRYTNTTENRRLDNAYPSGHTNAAFLTSLAYAYAFPERFSEMVYRGALLGENRIVAGMHSPVDVIGGKTMALALACAALNQDSALKIAEKAVETMYQFVRAKADSLNMSVYDYAHRNVENPQGFSNDEWVNVHVFDNNLYDNKALIKQKFREWMTYGFTQDTIKANEAPIVPKGAEAILKSRFPYLSDMQRRAVLYTTEIPSGYKILDKTNGWGRINLLAAADGYGSLIGAVNVHMDASLGRFNALDTWANNIDGNGSLVKRGTGKLILTGNNTYSGGTTIVDGILATKSIAALGHGNVSIEKEGVLEVNQNLVIQGNLTQNGGIILVNVNSKKSTPIVVEGKANISEGAFQLEMTNGYVPEKNDTLASISAKKIAGKFATLKANGLKIAQVLNGNTLYLVVE